MTALVWFRKDLRLAENPAWADATARHDRVQALFVLEPSLWSSAGRHRSAQLAGNLRALDRTLGRAGGRLLVVDGPATGILPGLAARYDAVYANADYSPFAKERDRTVEHRVEVPFVLHHGTLIHPPGSILTGSGDPYRVFTPFHKRWSDTPWPGDPVPGDAVLEGGSDVEIPRTPAPAVPPGEEGARARLEAFLERADRYDEDRDHPARKGTSGLSIDLKFGTISPRAVAAAADLLPDGGAPFVRQLAWREFYAHSLSAYPGGFSGPLRPEYAAVPWRRDPDGLEAWKTGTTGYPIVDAAMRQLSAEGWIHNRVRMIAASFLVKDLLIDWRVGERHFRRLLIDADPTQNVGNWQWVAGTGFDAAPYFRIMNPVTQGIRYDEHGEYVRRWVPELAGLSAPAIHEPWRHQRALAVAGITLGVDYPAPIVDHREARERTLEAYSSARTQPIRRGS